MKNAYEIKGEKTIIYIDSKKHGKFQVFIDTEDLRKVKKASSWHVIWWNNPKAFYVTGCFRDSKGNPTRKLLHRYVMGVNESNKYIDHIHHDTLDNRKSELRVVTNGENMQNGKVKKNNTSGFTGVTWHKQSKKWRADIKIDGVSKSLGVFNSIEEAKDVRAKAEDKYFQYKKELNKSRCWHSD